MIYALLTKINTAIKAKLAVANLRLLTVGVRIELVYFCWLLCNFNFVFRLWAFELS